MAPPMITVTKKFQYRGADELWSNSYHLTDFPVSHTAWEAFALNVMGIERSCYSNDSVGWSFLGYQDSANPATWSALATDIGANLQGTLAIGSDQAFAGDQAGTIGWKTGFLSTRGKPIWLRKYFHDGFAQVDPSSDYLSVSTATAYADFGAALLSSPMGLTDVAGADIYYALGSGSARPAGPVRVDPFVTTRTLERRGKRP